LKSENVEILSITVITTAMKMTANDFKRSTRQKEAFHKCSSHITCVTHPSLGKDVYPFAFDFHYLQEIKYS